MGILYLWECPLHWRAPSPYPQPPVTTESQGFPPSRHPDSQSMWLFLKCPLGGGAELWRTTALRGQWGKEHMGGLGSSLSPLISMWCWEVHLCLWLSGWTFFWKMREWNLIVPEVLSITPQPLGLNQNKSLSTSTFCDCTSYFTARGTSRDFLGVPEINTD